MKAHAIAFAERISSTFLFAAIGVALAQQAGITLLTLKAAGIAGGLSVAKYLYTLAGAYLSKPDPFLTPTAAVISQPRFVQPPDVGERTFTEKIIVTEGEADAIKVVPPPPPPPEPEAPQSPPTPETPPAA